MAKKQAKRTTKKPARASAAKKPSRAKKPAAKAKPATRTKKPAAKAKPAARPKAKNPAVPATQRTAARPPRTPARFPEPAPMESRAPEPRPVPELRAPEPAYTAPAARDDEAPPRGVSRTFTLFTAFAILSLIGLGLWQLKRHDWKVDLIQQMETRKAEAPILLPSQSLPSGDLTFRRIHVDGFYLHLEEIVMQGKTYNGTRGVHVITPMALPNGKIIIINRGWVPEDYAEPSKRRRVSRPGLQNIEGLIWKMEEPASYLPQNQPDKGMWLWLNHEVVAYYTALFGKRYPGLEVLPVVVRLSAQKGLKTESELPIMPPTEVKLMNDHLQYAATWFLLAFIVLVMSIIYHKKNAR